MDRIRPGAAAAADVEIFALAAFALVGLEVPQIAEDLGVLPYFAE